MLTVKPISEAFQITLDLFGERRSDVECVSLNQTLHRVLATDIHAIEFTPDFNRSTVDGFAIKATDVFGCSDSTPALLTRVGEVRMGEQTELRLEAGQCIYVPTGAEIPNGADAVVMLENAEDMGDGTIAVYKASAPGTNMIFRGDDLKPGDVVLSAGKMVSVVDIGALAAMGIRDVSVRVAPKVAILSTGDELVDPKSDLAPGKIRDVNAPMLVNAVLEAGGDPEFLGIIKDDFNAVRESVTLASETHDIVLITGGTSVGVKDSAPRVIEELGQLIFHGLAVKPGKPTLLGIIHDKPVFGLPGNPVAAYFMFRVLVRPLIYSYQGAVVHECPISVPVSRAVSSNHGREEFVPVLVQDGWAKPIASKSGLITTISTANGFLRIPRDKEGLKRGEQVQVYMI